MENIIYVGSENIDGKINVTVKAHGKSVDEMLTRAELRELCKLNIYEIAGENMYLVFEVLREETELDELTVRKTQIENKMVHLDEDSTMYKILKHQWIAIDHRMSKIGAGEI